MGKSRTVGVAVAATTVLIVVMFIAGFVSGRPPRAELGVERTGAEPVPTAAMAAATRQPVATPAPQTPSPSSASPPRMSGEFDEALANQPPRVPAIAMPEAGLGPALETGPDRMLFPPPAPAVPVDTSGTFEPIAVSGDIASIDFFNRFTYPVGGIGPITVSGGSGEAFDQNEEPVRLAVTGVVYGDLSNDGVGDAAVATRLVGVDYSYDIVWAYSVRNGRLEQRGRAWPQGAVVSHEITNGTLRVTERSEGYSASGSVTGSRVWFAGSSSELSPVESLPWRTWLDAGTHHIAPLEFAPGTMSATVHGANESKFTFEGSSGQTVQAVALDGEFLTIRITDDAGRRVGSVESGSPMTLPKSGTFMAEIASKANTTVEFAIGDKRRLLAPTWHTRADVGDDRQLTLLRPEFATAHGAADVVAVNETIERFVDSFRSDYVEAAATCERPLRHELSHRPTLVSYDLVSIRFTKFAQGCDGDYFYGNEQLTIDMNTGRELGLDAVLNTANEAFIDDWWTRSQEHLEASGAAVDLDRPASIPFRVELTPDGARVGVEPRQVDAFEYGLSLFYDFDELAGVVDPGIALRASSGRGVPLPVEAETCGC